MKKAVLILVLVGVFSGCSNQNDLSPVEENLEEPGTSAEGTFISGAHTKTGSVSVSKAEIIISFTDFKTDIGPKLLVYLTTEVGSNDFVSLGDLKGIAGDFMYDIPNNTDLTKYNIVDIWCIDASVSFGHAELN